MGAVAAAVAIAERDSTRITGPNHRQPPQDGGDGQDVNDLLPRKGLVDQLEPHLVIHASDPAKKEQVCFVIAYYGLLRHIKTHLRAPA